MSLWLRYRPRRVLEVAGDAIPSEYFLFFEAIAAALLFLILYRIDINKDDVKIFDVVVPVIASFLFFSLALQGNNVIDAATGEAVRVLFAVIFDYAMGVFCLIPFFLTLFKFMHKQVT